MPVSGPGGLAQAGSGVLTLTASNTYGGPTTISAGTLQLGAGGSINQSSGVVDNAALTFNRANSFTFTPGISGSGSVTQLGSNTVTLSGVSSYTGPTNVASGELGRHRHVRATRPPRWPATRFCR